MTKDWASISYIKRSAYRERVLKELDEPKTPTQLANSLKLHKSHISYSLTTLVKKGFVVCRTPKARMYRIYERTPKGNKIIKDL